MQLHNEYLRITNQILHSFLLTVQMFSIISVRCLKFTLYLNRVFTMSVFTSCSNTRSKYVAKWHNCYINEFVKQISLYRPQNGLLARIPRNDVGQLWHVSLIVFPHPTHDNPLAYWFGAFAVVFTSESLCSYLFTEKIVLVSSNGCNF